MSQADHIRHSIEINRLQEVSELLRNRCLHILIVCIFHTLVFEAQKLIGNLI
ncbi:Uncharacterised protein [Mycobacteroides abscessus subsp. abscessus]|nr:Uncharacterised protein [Mycobacteroides abscessus subsp. abscessus]SHY71270.1 Uncharacterised protein [Mycobacteroides abscessus subsp. abscessus]SKR90631.1 Uncharacterised protein [Mycobacteroides abscessus subsp. abscessus]